MLTDRNVPNLPLKIAQLAWAVALLAFAIPFSRIVVNGTGYLQFLLRTYAGQLAFGITILLALFQWLLFFYRKKWLAWPSIVAGLYLLVLVVRLALVIFGSFTNTDTNNLALVMKAENQPMPGLFLLGIASLVLLLSSAALGFAKRKAKTLAI